VAHRGLDGEGVPAEWLRLRELGEEAQASARLFMPLVYVRDQGR